MAEEAAEVLVLTDYEGNLYAIPRRLLERTRVPDELKGAVGDLGRERGTPQGRPRLPWAVGWFRMPAS